MRRESASGKATLTPVSLASFNRRCQVERLGRSRSWFLSKHHLVGHGFSARAFVTTGLERRFSARTAATSAFLSVVGSFAQEAAATLRLLIRPPNGDGVDHPVPFVRSATSPMVHGQHMPGRRSSAFALKLVERDTPLLQVSIQLLNERHFMSD